MNDLILSRVNRARALLLQCTDPKSTKRVIDMAQAAKIFAQRQQLGKESIDYAHAVIADGQKLLGDLLRASERRGLRHSKRPGRNGTPRVPLRDAPPTLAELGIPKKISSVSQLVSRVAEFLPDLFKTYWENRARLNDFRRAEKKAAHAAKIAESRGNREIPLGPFDIVLADPPWKYEHCEAKNREIENHYRTAGLDVIFKHRPATRDESILFLWATAPLLESAIRVMGEWGFTYRSCAVWDKERMGMGYWWRIQHELLLVGVRGSPNRPPESERISSIIRSPRAKHSAKPDCVREWIERAYPDKDKLEMYCRSARPGWATWGDEV